MYLYSCVQVHGVNLRINEYCLLQNIYYYNAGKILVNYLVIQISIFPFNKYKFGKDVNGLSLSFNIYFFIHFFCRLIL